MCIRDSSNTTDNALLQCVCLSVLVPAPLNLLGLTLQIIAAIKTLGAITPKDHSIAPANHNCSVAFYNLHLGVADHHGIIKNLLTQDDY